MKTWKAAGEEGLDGQRRALWDSPLQITVPVVMLKQKASLRTSCGRSYGDGTQKPCLQPQLASRAAPGEGGSPTLLLRQLRSSRASFR